MAILQLVDQMTDLLNEGREVPLSRYRMVDSEEFSQMLERMRISVPSSIRESERTLVERDNILARARAEADQIVQEARDVAAEMLGENSLVVMARQEAHRIIDDGQEVARQRTSEADSYATQVLQDLHERLASISGQVENGIAIMTQQNEPFGDSRPASGNLEMRSMRRPSELPPTGRTTNPLVGRTAPNSYEPPAVDTPKVDNNRDYEMPQFDKPEFDTPDFDNSGFADSEFADSGINDGGFDNSRFDNSQFSDYAESHGFEESTPDSHTGDEKPLQPPTLNYLSDPSDPMSDNL